MTTKEIKRITPGDYSSSFNEKIYNLIPCEKVVLDVGCSTGNLGRALVANKKCIVDGMDIINEHLDIAKASGYREIYKFNLNSEALDLDLIEHNYDVIIFADILEHLIDPVFVLTGLRRKLKKNGMIIISLPNVAFILNRLHLLVGKWEYKDYGILDKTHLRFFTIRSGEWMIKDAGYTVEKIIPYNQFGVLRFISPLEKIFPTLLAYQYLIIAHDQ